MNPGASISAWPNNLETPSPPRHQPADRIIGKGEEEHDRFLGIAADIIPADPDIAAQLNTPLFRRADIIIGGVVKASMLRAPLTPEQ